MNRPRSLAADKNKTSKRAGKKTGKKPAPASSRGQQRKVKILAAATKLFLKVGYGETSIDAIVQKSGGSKATLYSVVPTKADLFRALFTTQTDAHWLHADPILTIFPKARTLWGIPILSVILVFIWRSLNPPQPQSITSSLKFAFSGAVTVIVALLAIRLVVGQLLIRQRNKLVVARNGIKTTILPVRFGLFDSVA